MSDTTPAPVPTTRPGTERFAANDPCGEDSPAYRYLFQAWIVLFLLTVCGSLTIYLVSFVVGK